MKQNLNILSLLILFIVINNVAVPAQEKKVLFDHIDIQDGLSQSSVYAICQDHKGFMWFGTAEGLNRYDGNEFKIYKANLLDSTTIQDSWITVLYEDSDSVLWIGTHDGGLARFDRENDEFIRYMHVEDDQSTISDNNIFAITEGKNHTLWIATNYGLSRFDKKTETFKRYRNNPDNPNSLSSDYVNTIKTAKNGKIWIGTDNGGLNLFDPETEEFQHFLPVQGNQNSISHEAVWGIQHDPENEDVLWISTANGLDRWNRKTNTFVHYAHEPDNKYSIGKGIIRHIHFDQNNDLWICHRNNGLSMLTSENKKRGIFYRYASNPYNPFSLSKDLLLSMYEDQNGLIWIGTKGGGINRTIKTKFKHFRHDPDNPNTIISSAVWSVYEDSHQNLWVGTEKGVSVRPSDSKDFKHYRLKNDEPQAVLEGTIYDILEDRNGFIWFATGNGLYKLNQQTGEFTHFAYNPNNPNGLSYDYVKAIHEDSRGLLWVATRGEGLNLLNRKTGTFTHYKHQPDNPKSLSHNRLNVIFEDKDGVLWIGTSGGGLNKMNLEKDKKTGGYNVSFTCYTSEAGNTNSLNDIYVMSINEDNNGNLWIGTWDGGLNKLDKRTETFTHYNEKHGMPNTVSYGILIEDNGQLWVSTNRGITNFDPYKETFTNYDISDGLQDDEFNSGSYFKAPDGTMYFGGIHGFNMFHPDSVKTNQTPPPVVITGFKIFNKEVTPGPDSPLDKPITETKHITLSYRDYIFSFEFAALSYISQHKNQYAYKMEGLDKDWIYTDSQHRIATYTNLHGGDYTFRVIASNNDGVWNEDGTAIKITILPPFWETWWFISLVIILVLGSIILGYRSRIKRIEKQKIELEQIVQKRTTEIVKQRDQIQEKNEELEQQKSEILKQTEKLREANIQLEEQQEEIQQKSEEISAQAEAVKAANKALHKEKEYTLGSIRYAKTIQSAILPIDETIRKNFDFFVIYRPKDIVSGDFYWYTSVKHNDSDMHIFAVVDCTGHGVPGAFMSMIGYSLLNEIIRVKKIYSPAQILEQLDVQIQRALRQSYSENRDGMDISLCKIIHQKKNDADKYHITYSGAKQSLFYLEQNTGEVQSIKGQRRSIGGKNLALVRFSFKNYEIELQKNDILYMTSDGIIDQNAPDRKRFGTKRLINILNKNAAPSLNEQGDNLEHALDNYQNNERQRDDITVLGIRL